MSHSAMAHTKHSHKKIPFQGYSLNTMRNLVKFDAWRWIDLGLIVASFIFLLAGRFTFMFYLFVILTVIEVLFEIALRRSNKEWQETKEGRDWVRRMIAAGRLFFVSSKVVIFIIALFLVSANW